MPGKKKWYLRGLLPGLLFLLVACNGLGRSDPQLLGESTLIPTVAVLPSLTPTPLPPSETPTPLPTPTTEETSTEAALAFVTPTLPPSRTPSPTPTTTDTPTLTFTPSWTPPPSATPTLTPFPVFTPGPVAMPTQPLFGPGASQNIAPSNVSAPPAPVDGSGGCLHAWFFSAPISACPAAAPLTSPAAFLQFERGMMFWFGAEQAIYVLYNDAQNPRWERYPDTWQEGMPERDPTIIGPEGLWQQPRRGFGHLWRNNVGVRGRLGWALHEWETPFTGTVQQAGAEGGSTLFITGPEGQIYRLEGDQSHWQVLS